MAETIVLRIGDNSPEHVAYKLLIDVARIEKKADSHGIKVGANEGADRKWLLDTYAECLAAAKNQRQYSL
jgi:hypothetical protein